MSVYIKAGLHMSDGPGLVCLVMVFIYFVIFGRPMAWSGLYCLTRSVMNVNIREILSIIHKSKFTMRTREMY